MSASALRLVLRLVAAAGIPGVIAGSIAGNDAVAITFGGVIATAAFGLILVTAVTAGPSTEALGASVESKIEALVARGVDEADVRSLVTDAVRLGARSQRD